MKLLIVKLITIISLLGFRVTATDYDWLFVYYMPYDNNLTSLSNHIIDQFRDSKIEGKICVTLQVDLAGKGGMTRYVFNAKTDSIHVDDERSAVSKTFEEYLVWVANNYTAKHYAIVLLNHGGDLNEYGLDEFPVMEWLRIDSVAKSIRKFNQVAGISEIDLLFEQVCTRGTIENLYEFKDVAKYTLASQDLVPAPGYYYPRTFSAVEKLSIESGDRLADLIVKSERADMYYSFTLIDNSKWNKWLEHLNKYSKEISRSNYKIATDKLKLLSYAGQAYFDLNSLIEATTFHENIPQRGSTLMTYTTDVLIRKLYKNSETVRASNYSGISIYAPFTSSVSPLSIYSQKPYKRYLLSLTKIKKK